MILVKSTVSTQIMSGSVCDWLQVCKCKFLWKCDNFCKNVNKLCTFIEKMPRTRSVAEAESVTEPPPAIEPPPRRLYSRPEVGGQDVGH